jgi:methylase of polypeptide subunit release factors
MLHVNYRNIRVFYLPHLEGGGLTFGQDYIKVVRRLFGKVDHICEFGAGPGFIGFSLLANGLCKRLTLIDINPEAVRIARKTVAENGLKTEVRVYLSDGLSNVPESEKWDLVVSNPPHFDGKYRDYVEDVRVYDPKWEIHSRFYRDVPAHLKSGGSVLFYENLYGARPSLWEKMIGKQKDLKYIKSFRSRRFGNMPRASDVTKYIKGEHGYMRKSSPQKLVVKTLLHASFLVYYPYYFVWSKKREK